MPLVASQMVGLILTRYVLGVEPLASMPPEDLVAVDPAGLEEFLAAQPDLSPKAWPRWVRIASELPTTATNKILKRELRERFASAG